ncbi:ATP-binding protein [Nocardioides sp.]|uniref:ATP-binding protein n=1 Tax=Nocardioides sp. TaxID=35761 RepID=UPI0035181883
MLTENPSATTPGTMSGAVGSGGVGSGAVGSGARSSLDGAIWTSAASGLALWQCALGVLITATDAVPVWLPLLHVALALLSVPAIRSARVLAPRMLFSVGFVALLGADLALTADRLAQTVLAMSFVVVATPYLCLPPIAATVAVLPPVLANAAWVGTRHDDSLVLAMLLPPACFAVAAAVLARGIDRHARTIDRRLSEAAEAHERLVRARATERAASEQNRVLHDTVINTLGVLAAGGRALSDVARVRRRCRDDVARLESLLPTTLRPARDRAAPAVDPVPVVVPLGLSVTWIGEAEQAVAAAVGAERWPAMAAAISELLRNVAKHAGVASATVATRIGDAGAHVSVVVSDTGVGFRPEAVTGRRTGGLAQSVVARCEEHGIEVTVTAAPGRGTRVLLTVGEDREGRARPEEAAELARARAAVARFGAWGWAIAVALATLLTVAIGGLPTASAVSAVLVAVLTLVAAGTVRRDRLPRTTAALLTIGVPVGWACAAYGALAPAGRPALWLGIGVTPLLLLLLVVLDRPRLVLAAISTLLATAVVVAVDVADSGSEAGIVLANAGLQVGQLGIWAIFLLALRRLTEDAEQARRRQVADRLALAELQGAARIQRFWREAQVSAALDVLRDVADGHLAPDAPALSARAATEEHHLRQLLLLPPTLVHLGPWLARALGAARTRGMELTLRVGPEDVADATVARGLGEVLADCVRAAGRGEGLVVARFGDGAAPLLTVVGPEGWGEQVMARRAGADGPVLHLTSIRGQDLLEVGGATPRSGVNPVSAGA